jgi:calcium permeable stress-gated cation channel
MMERPEDIINLLANSLPAQSSYFIQLMIISTFVFLTVELLRLYPLSVTLLRRCIGPRLTEKERQRNYGYLRPLDDPPDFWHAETFAQLLLYYVVFFVYAVIAPVVAFVTVICFTMLESGYRYQFFHNYPRANDTGGLIWASFVYFVFGSIIIAQLTLVGLLILKQSKFASPVIIPLIVVTAGEFDTSESTSICANVVGAVGVMAAVDETCQVKMYPLGGLLLDA